MAEIENLLDSVIEKEIRRLTSLPEGEEKKRVVDTVTQLHRLRMDEMKTQAEVDEKYSRMDMESKKTDAELAFKEREAESREADRIHDEEALKRQAKENKIDRLWKTSMTVFEVGAPLIFYGIFMNKGFEFEKNGSFTSSTFKNLLNRFRPTK